MTVKEKVIDNELNANAKEQGNAPEATQEELETLKTNEENPPISSNRDIFINNIKSKHPDLEDDEQVYGYANNNYNSLKETNKIYSDAVEGLTKAMEEEPEVAQFIRAVIKYPNDFSYALKTLPKDLLQNALDTYDEGVDDEDAMKSLSEYRERKKANAEYSQMFEENTKATQAYIQEVADEMGVEVEDVVQTLHEYALPILEGKFTKELITTLVNGKGFEKKVQEVADKNFEEGRIEGRNETIEEKKLKKKNDGLPMNNSGNINPVEKKKPNSVLAEYKAPNKF